MVDLLMLYHEDMIYKETSSHINLLYFNIGVTIKIDFVSCCFKMYKQATFKITICAKSPPYPINDDYIIL